MRPDRAGFVIISAGLLTFGLVFTFLQVARSVAAPSQVVVVVPTATPEVVKPAADSLASRMIAGQTAVGVPITGSEPLLRDLQSGDRLDILASLSAPDDGRPVTAVVVKGATVLRPGTSNDPMMVAVSSADAMVLTHLVLGGTRLAYAVWPAGGDSPPPPRPLDEQTARALLGLAPVATPPQAPPATPLPTSVPTPSLPAIAQFARGSGFLYQVQPGDTWDTVAATFQVSAAELRQWNEAPPEAGLDAWTLLFIPRRS